MGCAGFSPKKLGAALCGGAGEPGLRRQQEQGPRNVPSSVAHASFVWLWGGVGVLQPGEGLGAVLQLSFGPSLCRGKLFFIYCSLGKLCYC